MTTHDIYEGVWINWTYGSILGSTLTVSNTYGAFLVALVALFVRLVGQNVWNILSYLVFQLRSSREPRDAIYHQQQVVLRNATSDAVALWQFLKIAWYWRGKARNPISRSLFFLTSAILHLVAFSAAGIFSSRVTKANSEVLVKPVLCGNWTHPFDQNLAAANLEIEEAEFASNQHEYVLQGSDYAASCYNSSSTLSPQNSCLPFGNEMIQWSTNMNVPCPFGGNLCMNNSVVQFDTGFLNSHTHLGINSQPDRVEYRRVMTCAPITTDGYQFGWYSASEIPSVYQPDPTERFLLYKYGQTPMFFTDDTTYAYNDHAFASILDNYIENVPGRPYLLDTETYKPQINLVRNSWGDTFAPITYLYRSDADVTLIFLGQNTTYTSPVRDLWFQAATLFTSSSGIPFYLPLYPVSVVGCTEQHQIRNPSNNKTTPLTSVSIATGNAMGMPAAELKANSLEDIGLTARQIAVFIRSFWLAGFYMVSNVAVSGSAPLLAEKYNSWYGGSSLPDNQWVLELNHWFGTAMTAIQLQSLSYVIGPAEEIYDKYIELAQGKINEEWMCGNQITRREDYASFNMLGICIIFVFGTVLILINFWLDVLVGTLQDHSLSGRYRNTEWRADEMLQLQRMAYQHHGIGHWDGAEDLVPTTLPDEKFTLPSSTAWQLSKDWRSSMNRWWTPVPQDDQMGDGDAGRLALVPGAATPGVGRDKGRISSSTSFLDESPGTYEMQPGPVNGGRESFLGQAPGQRHQRKGSTSGSYGSYGSLYGFPWSSNDVDIVPSAEPRDVVQ